MILLYVMGDLEGIELKKCSKARNDDFEGIEFKKCSKARNDR